MQTVGVATVVPVMTVVGVSDGTLVAVNPPGVCVSRGVFVLVAVLLAVFVGVIVGVEVGVEVAHVS
jgi:hypothetical protein